MTPASQQPASREPSRRELRGGRGPCASDLRPARGPRPVASTTPVATFLGTTPAKHLRRALPAAAGWRAGAQAQGALGRRARVPSDRAGGGLIAVAAAGTAKLRRKLAEATALANLHGPEPVDEALTVAAAAGRFGDGDLAAILAHHQGAQVIAFPARASEERSLQRSTAAWESFGA